MEIVQLLRIKILYIPYFFVFLQLTKNRFMDYFKQQDTFVAKLKEDYEKGLINIKALAPYFRWKFDDKAKNPSRSQIWKMYDAIQEELTDYYMAYPNSHNETTDEPIWGQYAGYGDDKYIVAYLEAIKEEFPNLLMKAE